MKIRFLVILLISAQAGKAQDFGASDTLQTEYLEELVVSAGKIPEPRRAVPQQVELIESASIQLANLQTSADMLQNTGNVFVQRSQQGGGSPSLRGFEASRVLLVVDGVRMNNAIYRSGHLQNVITLDQNMLDKVEVLFGPSSTIYGSDALGGVVHFYTKNPELADDTLRVSGNGMFRMGSVNRERTLHADVSIGGKKFGSLTSISRSQFGDLQMGKNINPALGEAFGLRRQYVQRSDDNASDVLLNNEDLYRQRNSGYKQLDIMQKFLYKPNERYDHHINFQFSTSSNIPRYDRLTNPDAGGNGLKYAQWYYGPQQRIFALYNMNMQQVGKIADNMSLRVSYQNIEESRHTRLFGIDSLKHRTEHVDVFALTADFVKKINRHTVKYGLDVQLNNLKSTAFTEVINTSATFPLDTRYPGGRNKFNQGALYVSHTWNPHVNLYITDGIRVGMSRLHSVFTDKAFFPFPFDRVKQKAPYISGNIGVIYSPTSWKLSVLASTGFRVPNIDDLAKVFDSTPGTLIVPNPNVGPEKTVNGDISVTKFLGHRARLEGVFYATRFYDAIVVTPDLFKGSPTFFYDGQEARIMSSQNAGRAYLYGYSLAGKWDITSRLSTKISYNYTYGRVQSQGGTETPLDHIPPAFGRVGIDYKYARWTVGTFVSFHGWKRLADYSNSGEDNLRYATDKGIPAWYTINLRGGCQIKDWLTLQAGVDNLLDLQYRVFASGINAPGRNLFVSLRATF